MQLFSLSEVKVVVKVNSNYFRNAFDTAWLFHFFKLSFKSWRALLFFYGKPQLVKVVEFFCIQVEIFFLTSGIFISCREFYFRVEIFYPKSRRFIQVGSFFVSRFFNSSQEFFLTSRFLFLVENFLQSCTANRKVWSSLTLPLKTEWLE